MLLQTYGYTGNSEPHTTPWGDTRYSSSDQTKCNADTSPGQSVDVVQSVRNTGSCVDSGNTQQTVASSTQSGGVQLGENSFSYPHGQTVPPFSSTIGSVSNQSANVEMLKNIFQEEEREKIERLLLENNNDTYLVANILGEQMLSTPSFDSGPSADQPQLLQSKSPSYYKKTHPSASVMHSSNSDTYYNSGVHTSTSETRPFSSGTPPSTTGTNVPSSGIHRSNTTGHRTNSTMDGSSQGWSGVNPLYRSNTCPQHHHGHCPQHHHGHCPQHQHGHCPQHHHHGHSPQHHHGHFPSSYQMSTPSGEYCTTVTPCCIDIRLCGCVYPHAFMSMDSTREYYYRLNTFCMQSYVGPLYDPECVYALLG